MQSVVRMQNSTSRIFSRTGLLLIIFILVGLAVSLQSPAKAVAATGWQDTGFTLPDQYDKLNICFDATQPNTLLISNQFENSWPVGTSAYNWVSGQRTFINPRPFDKCNQNNGLLYAANKDSQTAFRFSSREPLGKVIQYIPDTFASDGSLQVYAKVADPATKTNRLYSSSDGGLTWRESSQDFGGKLSDITVSVADGRSIYALATEPTGKDVKYSIYFSADAGQTWEKRLEDRATSFGNFGSDFFIYTPGGHSAPVTTVLLNISKGSRGAEGDVTYLSADGGRSFVAAGRDWIGGSVDLFYSRGGLMNFYRDDEAYHLSISLNNGNHWDQYDLPYQPSSDDLANDIYHVVRVANNSTANLFFYKVQAGVWGGSEASLGDIWYSQAMGQGWQKLLPNMPHLLISPYAPLTLIGIKDNHVYFYDIPDAEKSQPAHVIPNNVAGSVFYSETGHNLWGMFKQYWEANGGLAQFGYPTTEPLREYNPSDGKIYTVQYFERNRFEYHPENAGTKFEVLLGLLGNQLTVERRDKGEGAFNRFANMNYQGGTYFPQTGHNLRNTFKQYWEANGGLALYGFPISEEFEEVNPDDHQTYVVQYFERNRFEYHPENKGTKYEVLLGLLGNTLLKQKGWYR